MNRSRPSHAAARVFRVAAFVLSLVALVGAVHAQTWAPMTATEPDDPRNERVYSLGFLSAHADSLIAFASNGYFRHAPDQDNGETGEWSRFGRLVDVPRFGIVTSGSTLLNADQGAVDRFPWGATAFDFNVANGHNGHILFESLLPALASADGTPPVFLVKAHLIASVTRGDGARGTWNHGSRNLGGYAATLVDVQPSPALPEGRLLAGVFNGTTYSDDGGETWQPSSAYGPSAFVAYAFAHVPEPGHPYGGPVFGGFDELPGEELSVWRSDDGGATWAEVHVFDHAAWGLATLDEIRLPAGRDGALYPSIIDLQGGPTEGLGRILRSWDGGVTWEAADDGMRVTHGGLAFSVNQFMGGPDGRLYAATDSVVWRTTAPLPVADETAPSAPPELGVTVSPNPSAGRVAVGLALPEPSASVRVEVFDGVGRRVAVLHEGAARSDLTLDLNTSAFAIGTYRIVVTADGAHASRALTVAR